MPRKFSIELPKLMVSRRPTKDQISHYPESPPPPARSVRPALPEDVEAALRSICTKIFNETNATSLPDTDHDLLRAFWQHTGEDQAVQNVHPGPLTSHIVHQVAGPSLPRRTDSLSRRYESPARSDMLVGRTHHTASLPKTMQRSRPPFGPRGDSIDTVNSISQSDQTDPSTAMTSAYITPAWGSKRGSAGAPWSQDDDSKRPHASKRDSKHSSRDKLPSRTECETTLANTGETTPAGRSRGFVHNLWHKQNDSRPPTSSGRGDRFAAVESATEERTGRTSFRSRAASSARSLSRGVREYLRPSSRRGPGETVTIDQQIAYEAAAATAAEASRPATGSSMRKPSMELFRRGRRSSRDRKDHDEGGSQKNFRHLNVVVASYKPVTAEPKQMDLNRALPPLPALDLWQDTPLIPNICQNEPPAASVELENEAAAVGAEEEEESFEDAAPELPKTPVSPFPLMCATAFPGDFDMMYVPIRTPSPISASSIRDIQLEPRSRAGSIALSYVSDAELESPMFAMLVGNRSVPDLKPHLVHNRRPSNPARPDEWPLEVDNVPALPGKMNQVSRHALAGRASMDDSIGSRPVVMLGKKKRKSWWKGGKPTKHDWMRDVEHSGSKSGVLVVSQSAAPPIVRYC